MWRVLLSVFAAGFDALMIVIMALTLPNMINPPHYSVAPHAVVASASTQHGMRLVALMLVGFVIGGFCLNLLAIAFGARLRIRRGGAAAAAEFA